MKKFNKKGFTLIELLAVIIILAILMTLAITALSGYIRDARKDTFITTAQQYANAARLSFVNGEYDETPGRGQCLVVQTDSIALESGSADSSFDSPFVAADSYIVIYNSSSSGQDEYKYYMQMVDKKRNGFGLIGENAVERENVIEKDVTTASGSNYQTPAENGTLTLEPKVDGKDAVTCSVIDIVTKS